MFIGFPNLYDKFLIARFIAIAISLAIIFLLSLLRKKRWTIPTTPVFLAYLLFVVLCGCSIIWATNTAEAVFAFACQLFTPLIIVVFFSLLTTQHASLEWSPSFTKGNLLFQNVPSPLHSPQA